MIRTIATALVFLTSLAAQAQSVNLNIDPNGANIRMDVQDDSGNHRVEVQSNQVEEHSQDGYKVRYETNPEGSTVISVLQPEGAHVEILDGSSSITSEDIPVSVPVRSDVFYRFIIQW